MNNPQAKRRIRPTELCQYGEKCYRKNPHHFMEYSHVHLDTIIAQKSAGGEYKIPSELDSSRSIILDQLKIINDLFPSEPLAKKVALSSSERDAPASASKNIAGSASAGTVGTADKRAGNKEQEDKGKPKDVEAVSKKSPVETNSSSSSSSFSSSSSSNSSSINSTSNNSSSATNSSTSQQKITEHPRNIRDYIPVVLPRGKMAEKLAKAAPYNYFLTAITSSPRTHTEPLSITLQEILDPSLGEIESTVQINYMVDIGWLLGHYHFAGCLDKPMLVLYGNETPELQTISQKKPQVSAHFVRMATPFATHHTKMMLLGYKDKSMRVVVSTANLYEDDWHNRVQGLWISPRLEELPDTYDTTAGESPTQFRNELLKYLTAYNIPRLQPWLTRIRKSNFSAINVFLITSVPGTHNSGTNGYPYGHPKVGWLLSKHSAPIEDTSPLVAQSSSIGSFGANANVWLLSEFTNSFRRDSQPLGLRKVPQFRMIYPSFNNVMASHDGALGGGCLPYGDQTHKKQTWLQKYMFQWKASGRFRTQSMPHIKTYARWTDKKLFWFLLTSANLSKAAWGSFNKGNKISTPIRVANYEAGVLFLPKFVTGGQAFPMDAPDGDVPAFPSLYDIPLTPFGCDDTPFLSDILFGA